MDFQNRARNLSNFYGAIVSKTNYTVKSNSFTILSRIDTKVSASNQNMHDAHVNQSSQGRVYALRPLTFESKADDGCDFDVLSEGVTSEEYQKIVVVRLSSQDGIDQTVSPVRAGPLFWGHFIC